MSRKLLPLAFVLALAAAACAEPPSPEVEFGSGQRFVPFVADPLNDAGVDPSVVVNADGLPVTAYFGFEEQTKEGELPAVRPVTAPTLPAVLMATASADGIWTRGAMALQAQIPNVTIAFDPGIEKSVADLSAGNVTGLRAVADGDTVHAVWGSRNGLFYATGSIDPASTTPYTIERVTSTPPVGPSIAVVDGTPWVSYATSTSTSASIVAAHKDGSDWTIGTVSSAAGCETCTTAVMATSDGPAVAFAGGETVWVATQTASGWESRDVEAGGAQGIAGVATADGIALSYYSGNEVHVATGSASGPFEVVSAAKVATGSATAEGSGTSIAVEDAGTLWLGWFDVAEGIGFASSGDGGFDVVETGSDTMNGKMPSVNVTPDGSTAYLAWYDTTNEDLLVGAYGDLEGLAIAVPSPTPSGPPGTTGATGSAQCTEAADGVVSITAVGIAFDTPCVNVAAGEAVTIAFDNQDSATQHNVQIYPSSDEISADSALTQDEIITGPAQTEYQVPALDTGTYYFQCDIHPNMNGAWNVGGGGGTTGATGATGATGGSAGTGSTGGGGGVTVTALGVAFDTSTIQLPAGTSSTITFDNQDAGVQHNIAIYADDTLAENLFRGDLVTGPNTVEYQVRALEAGEYYFQCDVHPTMRGSVVVQES